MKKFLIFFFALLTHLGLQAQLEKVIVETYYISDSTDAADSTGGYLAPGSITYRIYLDLAPGCKLTKLFGNERYRLKISGEQPFFNHTDGKTIANTTLKSDLSSNTLALDTWLTLGQTTTKKGKAYFGVLKTQDTDGSFIGGASNDDGILVNADPLAGIPLTVADGMFGITTAIPSNWVNDGILDPNTLDDTTMFGSLKPQKEFISNNMYLANNGVAGVNPDTNQVLVAQLTTKGKISFELNAEIIGADGVTYTFVANGRDTVIANAIIKHSPFLTYPASCGCLDPHYLEYSTSYICNEASACKTRIVCGCTDTLACNYDPTANVNIPKLCCYPGYCNDRDIAVVCPAVNERVQFSLYPNPAEDQLNLEISGVQEDPTLKYKIYDSYGLLKFEKTVSFSSGVYTEHIDVSSFISGIYWLRMESGGVTTSKLFIKK